MDTSSYQPPPSYDDCVNRAFIADTEGNPESVGRPFEANDDLDKPPDYDRVVRGEFLIITHPVLSEVERLRSEMGRRERNANAEGSTHAQDGPNDGIQTEEIELIPTGEDNETLSSTNDHLSDGPDNRTADPQAHIHPRDQNSHEATEGNVMLDDLVEHAEIMTVFGERLDDTVHIDDLSGGVNDPQTDRPNEYRPCKTTMAIAFESQGDSFV